MDREIIINIEKLRGRELSPQEAGRLHKVSTALNIRDNDAVWALLAAMEYQRVFYEDLPKNIAEASRKIIQGISAAADKETAAAQAKLTDAVVKQAEHLSDSINYSRLLPLIIVGILSLLGFGSMLFWAGYQTGAGVFLPAHEMLEVPCGWLFVGLSFLGCIFTLVSAARKYGVEDKGWVIHFIASLCFTIVGTMLYCWKAYR